MALIMEIRFVITEGEGIVEMSEGEAIVGLRALCIEYVSVQRQGTILPV